MKRRNRVFLALAVVVIFTSFIIWATWVFRRKNQSIHVTPSVIRIEHENAISPTIQVLTQINKDFGSPDQWLIFNEDYQSRYRRFRFKHPPTFTVSDRDSALAWLSEDGELLVGIDENPLIGASSNRTAQENHAQLERYYSHQKRLNKKLPELNATKRIDFDENKFVYKFTQADEKSPGQQVAQHDEWNHYIGIIAGRGIDIYDLKKLPEDVVLEIIQSIEFKPHE
jgi:hypothetical protein